MQTKKKPKDHPVDEIYLAECLKAFFYEQLPGIQKRYEGRKNLEPPLDWPLGASDSNSFRQNQRLRQQLSVALNKPNKASESRKAELAIWYVEKWGGVTALTDDIEKIDQFRAGLAKFATDDPSDLIALGKVRIASWSKILSYRRYRTYTVFDARVAGSLNAAQIVYGGQLKHAFPLLSTRGAPAKAFSEVLKSSYGRLPLLPNSRFYELYCELLRSQWDNLPSKLRWHARTWHGLEMTLFHSSKTMFEKAADKLGSRQFYDQRVTEISNKNAEDRKGREEKKLKEASLG